jgi:hypothetical protein
MTAAPTLNETAALERHTPATGGVDLANAGRGIAATADTSIAVAWVQRYAVVYHVVDQIVDTPLFPVGFWPMPVGVKPWEFRTPWLKHNSESLEDYGHRRRIAAAGGTTAALWGEGYGWSPPQSWRLIYVANGKASLYAEGVNALLRAQGFGLERLERTEDLARLRLRRPGGPWVEYEFTMADAVRAGYVPGKGPNEGNDQYGKPKKGGNEKYLTDPKTMLWARCLTIAARVEAPDVIAGMPVAELADDDPIEPASAVTVTASARSSTEPDTPRKGSAVLASALEQATVRREAEASVALDRDQTHTFPPDPEPEPEPQPSPPIEQTDWRRLMARFNELGVNGVGRDARRLQVMSAIVDREITRGSELTKAEAQVILDNLAGAAGERLVEGVLYEPAPEQAAAPSGPPLPGEDDQDGDELDQRDVEPTEDEGRPAALEGVTDPWAAQ